MRLQARQANPGPLTVSTSDHDRVATTRFMSGAVSSHPVALVRTLKRQPAASGRPEATISSDASITKPGTVSTQHDRRRGNADRMRRGIHRPRP